MAVRILRVLEYIYNDVETMTGDMERWSMQSQPEWWGGRARMRSATVSLDSLLEEATPTPASVETAWFRCPDHPTNRAAIVITPGAPTAVVPPCLRWVDPEEDGLGGHPCLQQLERFTPIGGEATG